MNTKFKTLDLFAGIGGFTLGLDSTEHFETTMFCENDTEAAKVLKLRWPHIPIHGDVRSLSVAPGQFDVFTAGFPCQDISIAGKGKELAGNGQGS